MPGAATTMRELIHRAATSAISARRGLESADAVALTFDDGPHPEYTPQVLDVLAEHGARATFFVVGRSARRHPEIVRRALAEGHAVGSHTWSHPDGREVPWTALLRELHWGRRAVEEVAGRPVRAFRPPHGYFGGRMGSAARLAGLESWLWTADTDDWVPGRSTDAIVAALDGLTGGDVVLMHDAIEKPIGAAALDRSATVAALPAIIASARGRGLRFETLAT